MRIAILDDDPVHLDLFSHVARAMGHRVDEYLLGGALLRALAYESYDMLILDWQLPDLTGLKVLQWVRSNISANLPVLFVTNRDEERDIVEALNAGADDYLVKPVRIGEMGARIEALLRRGYPGIVGSQTFGVYRFDPDLRTIEFHGNKIDIPTREFDLAYFMFLNADRLLSRRHLLDAVWRTPTDTQSRSLDTLVSRLRNKLQLRPENGYRLSAVYGRGYRLESTFPQDKNTQIPKNEGGL